VTTCNLNEKHIIEILGWKEIFVVFLYIKKIQVKIDFLMQCYISFKSTIFALSNNI
jgi:hypothetical protein